MSHASQSILRPLIIAVPKGRILKALSPRLASAGIDVTPLEQDDRRLIRTTSDGTLSFVFLKPDDVPTYVEYGAADIGVCGRDTLLEQDYNLLCPLDLKIGRCRLAVAAPRGRDVPPVARIATKYPTVATEHFAQRGKQVEIIRLHGSVELAPLLGLADAIVDIVESGTTLKENDLTERETIAEISTHLVVNRVSYKLQLDRIRPLLAAIEQSTSAPTIDT